MKITDFDPAIDDLIIATRKEIVFIEDNVGDIDTLIKGIGGGKEIVILDSSQDGLEQIAQALAGRSGIDGLHIISHGKAGAADFGALTLDGANIGVHGAELQAIRSSLAPGADVLLYGCNIGAGEEGAGFLQQLRIATGADVAASNDLTGGAALGGDWILEVSSGNIETQAVVNAQTAALYQQVLSIPSANLNFNTQNNFFQTPGNMEDPDTNAVYKVNGNLGYQLVIDGEDLGVSAYAGMGGFTGTVTVAPNDGDDAVTIRFLTGQVFTANSISFANFYNDPSDQSLVIKAYNAVGQQVGDTATAQLAYGQNGFVPIPTTLTGMTGITSLKITATSFGNKVRSLMIDDLSLSNIQGPPKANQVTSSASGTHKIGHVIDIQVVFDSAVDVSGTPQLKLDTGTGRTADFYSGSGSSTLTFRYTVQAGDSSADLDYLADNLIVLNGGTMTAHGNPGLNASLTLPLAQGLGSLSANADIVIDGIAPTVTITSNHAVVKANETAVITFTFSEDPGGAFTDASIVTTNGSLSGLAVTANPLVYTATFIPATGVDGVAASITVNAGFYHDVAGNGNNAGISPSLTVDTVAPAEPTLLALDTASDSGSSPSDGITKNTTQTFHVTAAPGTMIRLYENGGVTQVGQGTADAGGDVHISTSLGAGVHTVQARAVDAAGNTSALAGDVQVTVDTAAPTVSITSSATSLKAGETATITFSFSDDPGPGFTWDGTSGNVNVSGGSLSELVGTGTTRTATFTPSANTDGGSASISVIAGVFQDTAGNNNLASNTRTIAYDTKAPGQPSAPKLASSDDSGVRNDDALTNADTLHLSGTADNGVTVKLYDGGDVIGTQTATGGNYMFTLAHVAEGPHSYAVVAVDAAGNVGLISAGQGVTVDRTGPTATVASALLLEDTGPDATDLVTSKETQVLSGTLSANLQADERVLVSLDGASWTAATIQAGTNTWTLPVTLAGSGTLRVKLVDDAGNDGTVYTHAYALDKTPPAAPSAPDLTAGSDTGLSNSDNVTGAHNPVFSGTAEANAVITLYEGSKIVGTGKADANGVWNVAASLDAGQRTITATATDLAGNESAKSAPSPTVTLIFDAPTTSVASIALSADTGKAGDFITYEQQQTISGSLSANLAAGERVQVSLDGGAHWVNASANVGSDAWSLASAALLSGTHELQVRVTNDFDNSGAVLKKSYTLDQASPTVTISSNKATLKAGETATITFTFDDDPGTTFTWNGSSGDVVVNGGTLSAISGSGMIRTATFTPAANVDSSVASIKVNAGAYADLAGNINGGTASLDVAYDTKVPSAPAAPLLATASDTAPVGDGVTLDQHPTIQGTATPNASVTLYDTAGKGGAALGTATADASGKWSIVAALSNGAHTLYATQSDAAGNESAVSAGLTLWIGALPEPEPAPTIPIVDGVPVDTQPISLPGGIIGSAVSIPLVGELRGDTSGLPGVADIPLLTSSGGTLLLAQVAPGYGLSASGASVPNANAAELLLAAIKAATPSHAGSDQAHLTANGQSFLNSLVATGTLVVETVKPVSASKAPEGVLTLSGPPQLQGHGVALVIDASGLGAGATLALHDMNFAAVIGSANVVSAGNNGAGMVLSGDAASQHFTVVTDSRNNAVLAGGGDDVLTVNKAGGLAGSVTLHGGAANDVAAFSGARADYDVSFHNGYVTVASKTGNQVATVVNVEQLQFSDGQVAVQNSSDMATLAGIYQSVLGRQADLSGIEFWANGHQAGVNWGRIALDIIGSSEHVAKGEGFNGTASHDIGLLYSALFNRAPDAAGLAFWTDAMAHGVSLEHIAADFVQSAEMTTHQRAAADWDFILA